MKFKIGVKVKHKKYGYGKVVKIFYDGGVRVQYDKAHSDLHSDCGECPSNTVWNYNKTELNELELVLIKKPTKQDLFDMPVGTKIYTDAKDEDYQVWVKTSKEDFNCNYNDYIDENDINEDLTIDEDKTDEDYGTKIIKIEKPTYETIYDYSTEVQEMTVAEIEEALGHAVKIIKEDN